MQNDVTIDPTVATLRKAVEQCRLGGRKARFSKALKQQIVHLLAHYSCAEVTRALGIGSNCLNRWKHEFNANRTDPTMASLSGDFVSLPTPEISAAPSRSNTFELTLVLQTGRGQSRVQLQAAVTPGQWQQILQLVSQALLA